MNIIKKQKRIYIASIIILNALVITTSIIYKPQWYLFLIILALSSLINTIHVFLLILYKCYTKTCTNAGLLESSHIPSKRMVYVLPCYNETRTELQNTIESIQKQLNVSHHKLHLVIICDGKIGADRELLYLLSSHITKSATINQAYKTWLDTWCSIDLYDGCIDGLTFTLIVKEKNFGKRDSLVLIRKFIYEYNNITFNTSTFSATFISKFKESINIQNDQYTGEYELSITETSFSTNNYNINSNSNSNSKGTFNHVDYIIGTDADTILDPNCANELLASLINSSDTRNIIGAVGFVDIDITQIKRRNPLVLYQYAEYIIAQCLRRFSQSVITNKVNCLSGCVQIIKVCEESCGEAILATFNRLPAKNESITTHIRSYASEDRNHISLMFKLSPWIKTIQARDAIVYTHVPDNLGAFIRQRKRWTLGATCNDLLLIANNNHPLWERLCSSVNVIMFVFNIFIFIATIEFIISIVTRPTWLMLALASLMIIPFSYNAIIPYTSYTRLESKLPYYMSLCLYYCVGPVLSILVYFYTLYKMDDFWWNAKTIESADYIVDIQELDTLDEETPGV
jgi:chitin synthase